MTVKHTLGRYDECEAKEQAMSCIHHDHLPGCTGSAEFAAVQADNAHLREQLELQLAQIRERADERDAFAQRFEKHRDAARVEATELRLEMEQWKIELRAERDTTQADNARLRALIKDAEFSNYHQAVDSGFCPWCDGDRRGGHLIKSATCSGTCPAFTPAGTVR